MPGIANNLRSVPYGRPIVGHASAMAESSRMDAETTTNVVVNHVPVTVVPHTPIPAVPVRTTPASATTAAARQAALLQQNNPYTPATRFSQYFPAPAPTYIDPMTMRVPNNYPLPSTRCEVPFTRFQSSAESLKNS